MKKLLSRRNFAKAAAGAGFGGPLLVETLFAEVQQKGSLSNNTIKALLEINDLGDLQLTDDELDRVRTSFERTLESIRKIRAYELRQSTEPSAVFMVRR